MKKILFPILSVMVLTGCYKQDTLNPNQLNYKEAQNVLAIKRGVVIAVEQAEVTIDGSDDVAAVSALAGGLAGSQVGQGDGQVVGAAVGAIAAGIVGKAITEKTEMAFVYTVELKNGGLEQVAQTGNLIPQASKVFVKYYPNNKKTISLDQSQGVTFNRTQETSYAEKDEKAEAAKAREMKRSAREQAEYDLYMESRKLDLEKKKLDLESDRLDVKAKESYTKRADDFANEDVEQEKARTQYMQTWSN